MGKTIVETESSVRYIRSFSFRTPNEPPITNKLYFLASRILYLSDITLQKLLSSFSSPEVNLLVTCCSRF